MTQIKDITVVRDTLDGTELFEGQLVGGGIGSSFQSTIEAIRRGSSLGTIVDTRGNANPGVTDMTAAWQAAVDVEGPTLVPEGDYYLTQVNLPVDRGDVTIIPMGTVRIFWKRIGASSVENCPIVWNGIGLASATTTVTSVTDEDGVYITGDGPVTRIDAAAGSFAAYNVGDHCHMQSQEEFAGYVKGEWFKVYFVDPSGDYILADRRLFLTYDAATYTTLVRRITSTPKLTIKRGIRFDTIDPKATDIGDVRPWGLYVIGAVEPEIDVHFDNVYSMGAEFRGIYGGDIRVSMKDVDVDYAVGCYGYAAEVHGAVYGTHLVGVADGGGHVIAPSGNMTLATWSTSSWHRAGVPDRCRMAIYARKSVRPPVDVHWAYNMDVYEVDVADPVQDPLIASRTDYVGAIGGMNITFGRIVARDFLEIFAFRNHVGMTTVHRVESLDWRNSYKEWTCNLIGTGSEQDAGTDITIIFDKIYSDTPGANSFPLNCSSSLTDPGFKGVIIDGYFRGCATLVRYGAGRDVRWDLHNIVYDPGDTFGTDRGVLRYNVAIDSKVRIFNLTVIQNAAGYPDGLVRHGSAIESTTYVGKVTCVPGLLPNIVPFTTGTVNVPPLGIQPERTEAPTDASASTVRVGTKLVRLSHTSGTPTVTIPSAASMLGHEMKIVHMALGGGTATIAPSAGTIVGAANTTIASAAYATYLAHGTDWVRVG